MIKITFSWMTYHKQENGLKIKRIFLTRQQFLFMAWPCFSVVRPKKLTPPWKNWALAWKEFFFFRIFPMEEPTRYYFQMARILNLKKIENFHSGFKSTKKISEWMKRCRMFSALLPFQKLVIGFFLEVAGSS